MNNQAITERFVRRAIINYLQRKGWARNLREKETHEQGVEKESKGVEKAGETVQTTDERPPARKPSEPKPKSEGANSGEPKK